MAKLTKAQRKAHAEACKILQDALSIDEKIFVLENWHEGAEHMNGAIGAHFTPSGLARDFAIDAGGGRRVIDLCAGIGGLGFWLDLDGRAGEMVCVEVNPAYVEVGRKILPQAQWICGVMCSRCLILDGSTSPYQTRHSGAVPRARPGRARATPARALNIT